MNLKKIKIASQSALTITLIISSDIAYGGDARELIQSRTETSRKLEEVIVTAQKRSEDQQTVPVSISAFTANDLADMGFDDIEDIGNVVPSMGVATNVSPLSTTFRIRHVGKSANIASFEPATGLYIDGAFRSRSGLGLGDLADVSAVEVLKGPQSTLYGKNVSAGVVSVSTQEPTEYLEGMAEISVGSDELRQFKGYISGPISDDIMGRLSVVSTDRGAWLDNRVGKDTEDLGGIAVRGQLLVDVSERLRSRLIVGYADKELHPATGDVFYSEASKAVIEDAGGVVPNNDPTDRIIGNGDRSTFTSIGKDVIFRTTYTAENFELVSITSYDSYDTLNKMYDAEQMSLDITSYNDPQNGDSFSQEFRIDADAGSRLKWLAGLFYYKNHFSEGDSKQFEFVLNKDVEELGAAVAKAVVGLGVPVPVPVPVLGVEGDRGDYMAKQVTESLGAFSKIDVSITEKLSASLGLRYSYETKNASLTQSADLSPLGCGVLGTNFICRVTPDGNNFNGDASFDAVTGSVSTRYFVTDDVMLYAMLSTGFKAGGFSLQNGLAPPETRPYDQEDITHIEFGWKAEFWDQRARVNGAIFKTEYNDFQEASFQGLFWVINNAELVTVEGVEMDALVILTEHLGVNFSVSKIDALYDTYRGGLCYYGREPDEEFGQCNLSGETMPGASELMGRVTLQWESTLGSGDFYSRLDLIANSGANSGYELDPRFERDDYGRIANLRMGWRSSHMDIAIWGKNITDEIYVTQSANANVVTPIDAAINSPVGSYQNFMGSPRELGITTRFFF